MLGGTKTIRRESVELTTHVFTPGIPGTPDKPGLPDLPLGPGNPDYYRFK